MGSLEPRKPSLLVGAAKGVSQIALAFYAIMLFVAVLATAGRHPNVAILMALLAAVPAVLGPGRYRALGLLALLIAGGFYMSARPLPPRKAFHLPSAPRIVAVWLPAGERAGHALAGRGGVS